MHLDAESAVQDLNWSTKGGMGLLATRLFVSGARERRRGPLGPFCEGSSVRACFARLMLYGQMGLLVYDSRFRQPSRVLNAPICAWVVVPPEALPSMSATAAANASFTLLLVVSDPTGVQPRLPIVWPP